MPVVHVATGAVISLVLAWSGVAKFREPNAMTEAMRALRVPERLRGHAVQSAVPGLELALAAALLLTSGVWRSLAWCATLALFIAYLILIVRAVGFEEEALCNCFGSSSPPVGRGAVVRNILLVTASAIGLGTSLIVSTSLLTELVNLDWSDWLGLVTIAVLFGLGWFLSREVAASGMRQVPGSDDQRVTVEAASEAESTEFFDYRRRPIPVAVLERRPGEFVLLSQLAHERAVLLLYVSTSCGGCVHVLTAVEGYADRLPELDVVVVVADRDAVASLPESVQARALVDVAHSLKHSLVLSLVPASVLLGTDGLLAGGPVFGVDVIDQMVEDVVREFELAGSGPAGKGPALVTTES